MPKHKGLTEKILARELKKLNCREIADKYGYSWPWVRALKNRWGL